MSAIPAVAFALACVALLIAAEAWWLIRSIVKRQAIIETMVTAVAKFIIGINERMQEEHANAVEETKRVN